MLPLKPIFFVLFCLLDAALSSDARDETVSKHGHLSVQGNKLVNQYGEPVQLRGMSLFWSQWKPEFWNEDGVAGIHNYCHSNVVRAAMGVEMDGYLTDPEGQMALVEAVIQAAIQNDIYVLVDWHEENANDHQSEAIDFFDKISRKYGAYPNVLYETFNEPINQTWSDVLKPYHEAVIRAIRANDPDNIIICGTRGWSQRVDEAADDPITSSINIMYTLHWYAGTNKQYVRDLAQGAIDKGLPIFVTEYGTVDADGDGGVVYDESQLWWDWCDDNKLSYLNWSLCDKEEGASALIPGTPADKTCQPEYLTESGRFVVEHNQK